MEINDQTCWIRKVFMKKQFLLETNVPFFVPKIVIISTTSCPLLKRQWPEFLPSLTLGAI
jgi:hypothetical protein